MKKRATKDIFVEALLKLAKRKSIDKISVKEIVEESGLSLQTFYNHFLDKADLILWVHKSKFDELLAKLGKDGYTMHDLTIENAVFYLENKDFMNNALSNTHGQNSYARQSADHAYKVLEQFILAKHTLKELPKELRFYLKMYAFASVYIYSEWAMMMKDITPEEFAYYIEEGMPSALKAYLLKES